MGIEAAIIGSSVLGIGSSIIGGNAQAHAARQSAAAQNAAAQQARGDLQPWRAAGGNALSQLANAYGLNGAEEQQKFMAGFQTDPGYQFRLQQGQQAIESGAAARGGLFSGNTGTALAEFGQGAASQEYGNQIARLSQLAGMGQSAAAGQGAAGIQGAQGVANSYTNMGNAFANMAGGVNEAVQGGIGNYLYNQRYNNLVPPGYTPYNNGTMIRWN